MNWRKGISILALLGSLVYAQEVKSPGAVFLMIWPGSRPTSLGGAFTAIANDALATYYNPAGLGFMDSTDISLMHCNWLPGLWKDMYYEFLGIARPIEKRGTIGFSVIYLTTGKTPVTNSQGVNLGEYTTFDIALGPSYGFKVFKNMSIGLTAKFIYSFLIPQWVIKKMPELGIEKGGTGKTWAADLGVLYKPSPQLSLGMALQNIGPGISYVEGGETDPLPRMLRLGLKYRPFHSRTFSLLLIPEITKVLVGMFYHKPDTFTTWEKWRYELEEAWKSIGVEFGYLNLLMIRLGYFEDVTGYRGGIVIKREDHTKEHVGIINYILDKEKRRGEFSGIGLTFGAGIGWRGLHFDVGIDQFIYDFDTKNYKLSLSYSF